MHARLNGAGDHPLVVVGGVDHDAGIAEGAQGVQGSGAVAVTHLEIENQDVRRELREAALAGGAALHLPDHLDPGLRVEQAHQPEAHDGMIVGHEDAHRACLRHGEPASWQASATP